MCVDNKCLETDGHTVELDVDNIENTTQIIKIISDLTDIDMDDMIVGVELDDDGIVIRIFIQVDDEDKAKKIEQSVNRCVNLK